MIFFLPGVGSGSPELLVHPRGEWLLPSQLRGGNGTEWKTGKVVTAEQEEKQEIRKMTVFPGEWVFLAQGKSPMSLVKQK